jgi:hypothetical protein
MVYQLNCTCRYFLVLGDSVRDPGYTDIVRGYGWQATYLEGRVESTINAGHEYRCPDPA